MASFNAQDPRTSDPNYMGSLKEPSRYDYHNRSFDTLFSGLTGAVDDVAKTAKTGFDDAIRTDVRAGYDSELKSMGVDAAVGQAQRGEPINADKPVDPVNPLAANKPPPEAAASFRGTLEQLQAAKAAGKIDDTYFNARMVALNRQVRSQYPGWRDDVDQIVEEVTGIKPANALRRSLLSDLETAQKTNQSAVDKQTAFLNQHVEDLPPDYVQRQGSNNPYTYAELYQGIQAKAASRQALTDSKAKLAYDLENKTFNASNANDVGSQAVSSIVGRLMTDATSGMDFKKLQEQIAGSEGKPPSPEQLQQWRAGYAALDSRIDKEFNDQFFQPLHDGSGKTLADAIGDTKKVEDLRKQAHSVLGQIDKNLTDGNYGLASIHANFAKDLLDSRRAGVLKDNDTLANVAAISGIPGMSTALPAVLASDPTLMGAFSSGLSKSLLVQSATPTGLPVSQQLDKLKAEKNPDETRNWFNKQTMVLNNPVWVKSSPQLVRSFADKMFAPENQDFLDSFKGSDNKFKAFTQLTSPQITRNIIDLDKQSPGVLANYTHWATDNFFKVFKGEGDAVSGAKNLQYIDVNFDAKAGRFVVTTTEAGKAALSGTPSVGPHNLIDKVEGLMGGNVQGSVDRMNRALANLKPVFDNQGMDLGGEIKQMLAVNDIDVSAKKDPTGFWAKVVHALGQDTSGDKSEFHTKDGEVDLEAKGKSAGTASDGTLAGLVRSAETGNDYDATHGTLKAPVSQMTINEVLRHSDLTKELGRGSGAAGAGQIIPSTLRGLVKQMGLTGDEKFDKPMQDRMIDQLLENRGLSKFRAGKMSADEFHRAIAQEWAALPTPEGKSYYEGDGVNHSTVGVDEVRQALNR